MANLLLIEYNPYRILVYKYASCVVKVSLKKVACPFGLPRLEVKY